MSEKIDKNARDDDALAVIRQLAQALESSSGHPLPGKPVPASEFVDALKKLHKAGMRFDENGMLSTQQGEGESDIDADTLISDLAKKHPNLPNEVRLLVQIALTGDGASHPEDRQAKIDAVRQFVITPQIEDRFFVRESTKSAVLESIDWEAGIKIAEKDWKGTNGIPFLEIAMLGTRFLSKELQVLSTFRVSEEKLEWVIDELQSALRALRSAKQINRSIALDEESHGDE